MAVTLSQIYYIWTATPALIKAEEIGINQLRFLHVKIFKIGVIFWEKNGTVSKWLPRKGSILEFKDRFYSSQTIARRPWIEVKPGSET